MRKHTVCCVLLILDLLLSGCGDAGESQQHESEPQVQSAASSATKYRVIDPPADGWTTEEIMSVTYFCGHDLNYPLTMEHLGKDFSLSGYMLPFAKQRLVPVQLSYCGESLANATAVQPHDDIMIYNIVLFPETCKVTDTEPFVINGIRMYDSKEQVKTALGDAYYYESEDSLLYNDRETGESLYSLFFEDNRLVHLNISFRFEIDLPAYRNRKDRMG